VEGAGVADQMAINLGMMSPFVAAPLEPISPASSHGFLNPSPSHSCSYFSLDSSSSAVHFDIHLQIRIDLLQGLTFVKNGTLLIIGDLKNTVF
jgi:hypothetical protein